MTRLLTILLLAAAVLPAQHDEHHSAIDSRGDKVMGFSHEKTTHHFRLYDDGGAIEVEANSAADIASRDQIRSHLRHIATMFAAGNFEAPMLIHAKTPPGVPAMQKVKSEISYRYRQTPRGAAVDIVTASPDALPAIHAFLRFQIDDHRTADATTVSRRPR